MKGKRFFAAILSMVLCLQMLPAVSLAADETDPGTAPPYVSAITGSGVKVSYDSGTGKLTLYRLDGGTDVQMSKPAAMGYPIIGGEPVQDFAVDTCTVETDITGTMGTGERMTITSQSPSTGLIRTYVLETSDTVEGVIYTTTSYQAGETAVTAEWFVDNEFELFGASDRIWSYNGGGEGPMHHYDTLQKIDLTDSNIFSRENKQDSTAASIPLTNIYSADGGITVGDASATRREVHTPVQETADSAQVSIKWPGETIAAGGTAAAGQSFIVVHQGDYYNGLRPYANAMACLGVNMIAPEKISARNYELRWESWGWGFNWTVDLIIGKMDELQADGVKQITVDDGWYTSAGDWALSPSKFPNGDADVIRLTDAAHAHDMTVLLWWRPCDGGTNSTLYQQHPEYYVKNANGNTVKLTGPGGSWDPALGYALCPTSAGAIASQVAFIDKAMDTWGFDGFKADYVWSIPKCYDETHNHAYPEESTEMQSELYRTAYEAMVANDPDVFNLLCNCGTPQDYYGMQYDTQIATSDPTSVDQTRRRVKAYKALMGDYFPVTTDHNEKWYPSAVGTGAVMIEKRDLSGVDKATYETWLDVANEVQLQKGRFIGDLYSYGFDPYETYVVEKDGVMHYAFYRDGSKYQPTGYPDIELKGLDPNKMYRIVDYVNDRVVATNLMGDSAVFSYKFSSQLLVKAVEIDTPDPDIPIDPDEGFTSVDALDNSLAYTGSWHEDHNSAFYEGNARYTSEKGASVEFTFTGNAVRWYGQKDTNFGTAEVYLDGELAATVNANGSMAIGELLFENMDLPAAAHTIRIVCKNNVIDIDRIAYRPATPEPTYEKVDALSDAVTYSGTWNEDHNDAFFSGNAKYTSEAGAYAEFTFHGTAIRWYGQTGPTFGTADVYLDGVPAETVAPYGEAKVGQLLFERNGLTDGEHTIKIIRTAAKVDLDYFSYVPSSTTDPEEFQSVDAMDTSLVYAGGWNDDHNDAYYSKNARYTHEAGASIEFTFTGTAIRWYGQNDTNFGTASVFTDDVLAEEVNVNGSMAVGKLLFERTDLAAGEHTIRIVCKTPVIDIDYLSYGA